MSHSCPLVALPWIIENAEPHALGAGFIESMFPGAQVSPNRLTHVGGHRLFVDGCEQRADARDACRAIVPNQCLAAQIVRETKRADGPNTMLDGQCIGWFKYFARA